MSKNKNWFRKRLLASFIIVMLLVGMLPFRTVKVAAEALNTIARTDSSVETKNTTPTSTTGNVIKTQPASQNLKVGEKLTFSIEVDGPAYYQWYKKGPNDFLIYNAYDNTFEIPYVSLSDEGEYYCMVLGNSGYVKSDIVKISVDKNPTTVALSPSPTSSQTRPNYVTLTAENLPSDATGKLIFKYGTSEIETVDLKTSKSISFKAMGPNNAYSFNVEYTGDDKYYGSISPSLKYDFTKGDQKTELQLNGVPNSKVYGDEDFGVYALGGNGTGEIKYGVTEETDLYGKTTTDVAHINVSTGVVTIKKTGRFKVTAVKLGDNDYNNGPTVTSDFITVNKKQITLDVEVNDKPYDGLNNATFSKVNLVGLLSNDIVSFTKGVPTFNSVNIGDNIDISMTPFKLSGDVENYTLIQPIGIKANIIPGFMPEEDVHYKLSLPDGRNNCYKSNDFIITASNGYKISLNNIDDNTKWLDKLTYSEDINNGIVEFYVRNTATNEISSKVTKTYTIDKSAPINLKIDYSVPILWKFIETVTFGFYKAPVTVTVSAEDKTSGIHKIEYSVINKEGDKYKNKGGILTTFTETDNKYKSSFTVPAQFRGLVSITAIDKAGNSTTKTETDKRIVIDNISPTVTVDYNAPTQRVNNVDYYKGDVTATIKITEANFFSQDVKVTVKKINNVGTVNKLYDASNTAIKNWTQIGDQWMGVLTLSEDGNYDITINYTDKSGNVMNTYTKKGITIDNTKPVVKSIIYDNNSVINSNYYKGNRNAAITIKEHNFRASDVVITMTAKDILGNDVTLPPISNWTSNGDLHTATITYTEDANYTFNIDYKDLANNKIDDYPTERFTVDKEKPTLQQRNIMFNKKNNGVLARFINFISFGYFCNEKIIATITAVDNTSGVSDIIYYGIDDKSKKVIEDVTVKNSDNIYNIQVTSFELPSDFKGYIFAKAIDRANNETSFVKSTGLIVESEGKHKETYEMSITPKTKSNNNGFYNEDFKVDLYIKDSYSGINTIKYTIGSMDPVTETFEKTNDNEIKTEWRKTETIKAPKNNSDVIVKLEYRDNAGNPRKFMQTLKTNYKIDITKPVISVVYDNNNALNNKFYKNNRIATITIDELNFKNEDVIITSTKNGLSQRINPLFTTKGKVHTMKIPYNTDGDYKLTVSYTDLAGNKADYNRMDEFTIDKTNPVISVKYDNNNAENGNYYKSDRKAIIKVIEHNWDLKKTPFNINLKAESNSTGKYVQFGAPKLGAWKTEGDIHTAIINFQDDGRYTLSASFTDAAGNKAANINEQIFVIDKTKPSVPQSLSDININSYVNGKDSIIAPKIIVKDSNYDIDKISISISGFKEIHKKMVPKGVWTNTANGRVFTFDKFANDKDADDIYTIKVFISDKAGNKQESSPLQFSVNHFGSTYNMGRVKDIKNGYFKKAKDVVITEINPNKIDKDDYILTISRNGTIKELVLNKDYSRELIEQADSFNTYTYKIKANNFKEDGKYVVTLQSKDEAKNKNSSDDEEKNGFLVSFIVDNTKPTAAVSGVVKGKTYSVDSIKAIVTITDNIKIYSDKNKKDNDIECMLNGEKIRGKIVEDKDTSKKYEIEIKSEFDRQTLQISFRDQAGNKNSILVEDFLINSNFFVQYYQNKLLFYGSISSLIVFIIGIGLFLRVRKREIAIS